MTETIQNKTFLDAAILLNKSSDHKVISRLNPIKSPIENLSGCKLKKAVVVDTETTGVNPEVDAIIELGMVFFEYNPLTGQIFNVIESFDELEYPGFSIPPSSTEVHGITDDMVAGKRIDDTKVINLLKDVSLVIAHNSKFDRVFLEKRLPIFETLPWGCTFAQVDWAVEGISSAKLDYIAYQYGFFFDAHRAEVDCFALVEILQKQLPKSGELVLQMILKNLHQKSYTICALGSPFETKDTLKAKGYRWNAEKRCWHTTLSGDDAIKSEVIWLKEYVYSNKPAKVEIEVHTPMSRFSNRAGNIGIREI